MSDKEPSKYYVDVVHNPNGYIKWELTLFRRNENSTYGNMSVNYQHLTMRWPRTVINYAAKRIIRKQIRKDARSESSPGKWRVE